MGPQDLDNFQKEILERISEGKTTGPVIAQSLSCDISMVNYNLKILMDNGFIKAAKAWQPGNSTGEQDFFVRNLTDKGKVAIREEEHDEWQLILRFISQCLPENYLKQRTTPCDKDIATDLDLDLSLVRYYLVEMEREEYVELIRETDTYGDEGYIIVGIKPKGHVAIRKPNKIRNTGINKTPDEKIINQVTFQNLKGNFAFNNQGTMIANIGPDTDEIVRLMSNIKEVAESFPIAQKELVEGHLEDLSNDYTNPSMPSVSTLKRRIIGLFNVAIVIAGAVATATDFANNVFELSRKLDIPVEEIQPYLETFQHLKPDFEWRE